MTKRTPRAVALSQLSFGSLSIALLALTACGNPSNSGKQPAKLKDLDCTTASDTTTCTQLDKAQAVADYMGFDLGTNESDSTTLVKKLSTTAGSTASTHKNYAAIQGGILSDALGTSFETQCDSIEGIKPLYTAVDASKNPVSLTLKVNPSPTKSDKSDLYISTTAGGKAYVIRYYLKNKAGQKDSVLHTGIITVPDTARNIGDTSNGQTPAGNLDYTYPLAMYAHGGDSGLSYFEIATLLGDMQDTHIVASPTYPGEPLCTATKSGSLDCVVDTDKGYKKIVTETGSESVWDGDVKEFLGLQNCIMTKLASPTVTSVSGLKSDYSAAEGTVANPLAGRIKPHGKKRIEVDQANLSTYLTNGGFQTMAFGTSRGGNVAYLAAARTGMFLKYWNSTSKKFDSTKDSTGALKTALDALNSLGTFIPAQISALGVLQGPSSPTMGRFRLSLEFMMRGSFEGTALSSAPTSRYMKSLIKAKLLDKDLSSANTAAVAVEIAKRDMTFVGGYTGVSIQNWTAYVDKALQLQTPTNEKGAVAVFHSIEDLVVPFEQSQVAFGVFQAVNADALNPKGTLNAAGLKGYNFNVFAFQPKESFYTSGKFNGAATGDYSHGGNPSFLTAKMANPVTSIGTTTAYDGSTAFSGSTAAFETATAQLAAGVLKSSTDPVKAGVRRFLAMSYNHFSSASDLTKLAALSKPSSAMNASLTDASEPVLTPSTVFALWRYTVADSALSEAPTTWK